MDKAATSFTWYVGKGRKTIIGERQIEKLTVLGKKDHQGGKVDRGRKIQS